MQESLRLNQEQKLTQRLSPMQVRFVKLLEMNSPEADEAVRRELDDNPALAAEESFQAEETTDDGSHFNALIIPTKTTSLTIAYRPIIIVLTTKATTSCKLTRLKLYTTTSTDRLKNEISRQMWLPPQNT